MKNRTHVFFVLAFLSASLGVRGVSGAEILPPGHRPLSPGVHALVGAKVVTKPGEVLENATVVIRDGFIAAVGKDISPPPEARIWTLRGATVYPGLIDIYLTLAGSNAPVSTMTTEPIDDRDRELTAGGGINFYGVPGDEIDPGGKGPGYSLDSVTPNRRLAETYTPSERTLEVLHELGFTVGNIVPEQGLLRGSSALVALSPRNPTEGLIKPDVFQHVSFVAGSSSETAYPRSLMGGIAAVRQALFDADHYARDHQHYKEHPQGRHRPAFNPALEALSPATSKKTPLVVEPGSVLMVDRAARMGRELGFNFLLVASGHEWRRPDLVKAAAAPFIVPVNFPEIPKLPEEDDWLQVSLDQLRAWDWAPSNPMLLREQGLMVSLTTYGLADKKTFRKKLRLALDRGFTEEDALAALTTIPAQLCGVDKQLGTIEPGKIANLTIVEGESYFDPESRIREVWVDGRAYFNKPAPPKSRKSEPDELAKGADKAKNTNQVANPDTLKLDPKSRNIRAERIARSPLDNRGPLTNPPAVLVRGATLWTCAPQGRRESIDLLVVNGKIKEIGKNLQPPSDLADKTLIIEAEGKHLTPGLIDAHNHSMILGMVNEGTIPSSAMVRVADVVNSETVHLYRQLAGGLTTANLLHGSANPIGGQNCVIKLRDGGSPEELKFAEAPPGIKFALGENVKQANWGENRTTRFPQTRMGVGTFFANRFAAAQQYIKAWENGSSNAPPPRKDLELETLAEILQGKRWIHCHSYRQDEILAFLRLMEQFKVKVGTLQHVLEGYKVADEIAAHGAGASCFSDWWAYKFEVYDAIPYAGTLMRNRGVLVSFNSDSSDHARRMNLEAAKAVKYGGTSEEEALKFVTLNPAQQLRVDKFVGSLEPGKHADFVLWSKSPLDSQTVCLQTWVDGRKYFDREADHKRSEQADAERKQLIEKAKKILKNPGRGARSDEAAETKFFEVALEHRYDNHDRHCMDEEE